MNNQEEKLEAVIEEMVQEHGVSKEEARNVYSQGFEQGKQAGEAYGFADGNLHAQQTRTETYYQDGYDDGFEDGKVLGKQDGLRFGRIEGAREMKEDLENISQELETLNEDYRILSEFSLLVDEDIKGARNKHLAIGFGTGLAAGASVGLLAVLREKKVKQHIIGMIEDACTELERTSENKVPLEIDELCANLTETFATMRVRSLFNPFGISRKDSDYVTSLLLGIIKSSQQVTLDGLGMHVANPEDIEAIVQTTPAQ